MSKIQLTPDELLVCGRAHRLQQLVTAEGYRDMQAMMREIEDEALAHLYAYEGTDDHETAVRAFQWKTIKAGNQKLLGRIRDRIKAGEAVALSKVSPEALGQSEDPLAFPGVRPQCDVEPAAAEEQPDAPPKPPIQQ